MIAAYKGAGASVHSGFRDALAVAARETRAAHGLDGDDAVTVSEALDDLDGPPIAAPDSPQHMVGTYVAAASPFGRDMRAGVAPDAQPDSHRFPNHTPVVTKLFDEAHKSQLSGRLDKSFMHANGSKKHRKVLLGPDDVAPTVTTHPDDFIHHRRSRVLTIREMARLQSFPDSFAFKGRYYANGDTRGLDVPRVVQVGNAIPPLLGEGLARAVASILSGA